MRLLTLNDFDFAWLSSSRALEWYDKNASQQALARHLQSAFLFCRTLKTCLLLEGLKPILYTDATERANQATRKRCFLLMDDTLPVSQLFWTAMTIDSDLQVLLQDMLYKSNFPAERDCQSLEWGFFAHKASFFVRHWCSIMSLLWAERLSMTSTPKHCQTSPGMAVAEDLVNHKIKQTSLLLARLLEAICCIRLPLLAHTTYPHIMENIECVKNMLKLAINEKEHDTMYQNCGEYIENSISRYKSHVTMHSTRVGPVTSPGAESKRENDEGQTPKDNSSPSSVTTESDITTPVDMCNHELDNLKAHWEYLGGELLHNVDYVRLF